MSNKYLTVYFSEKDLDREEVFEVPALGGTMNLIPCGVVIDQILGAPSGEQAKIATVIRKIDFRNGDVRGFLRHLAGALAFDL